MEKLKSYLDRSDLGDENQKHPHNCGSLLCYDVNQSLSYENSQVQNLRSQLPQSPCALSPFFPCPVP